jgi:hypothetical protein
MEAMAGMLNRKWVAAALVLGLLGLARPAAAQEAGPDLGGEILFAERAYGRDYQNHYYANMGYDCGNETFWLHGADGGRLSILDPVTKRVRVLVEDEKGAFRDPRVSYDAKRVLFSYRKGGTHHYNLYEMNLDGTGLRQLTFGDWDDIEPCYLPDGDILFCSTRCMRYVLCWLSPVPVLFRCRAAGSGLTQVSSGVNVESTPSVLRDGRIVYTRWEYVNRATTRFHQLWVVNPDGTGATTFFGNMHPQGSVYIDARAVPGSNRIVYVDSGHCSNEHAGTLVMLDPSNGPDDLSRIRTFAGKGRGQALRDPFPLSPTRSLATRGNDLVLVTDTGAQTLLYRSAYRPVHEPQLIAPREREPVIPSKVDPEKRTGTLFLHDVTLGRKMKGVKAGAIRKLLVMIEGQVVYEKK